MLSGKRKIGIACGGVAVALALFMGGIFINRTSGNNKGVLDAEILQAESLETSDSAYSQTEINSSRHTQYVESTAEVQSTYTVDGYTLRLESDVLEVWVQDGTSRVRFVDKRSGYVWGLCVDEQPDGLNKTWYARASALCAIEYYDASGSEKSASSESEGVSLSYDWGEDSFCCNIDMEEIGIRLSVEVALTDDRVSVSVVDGSLEEYEECTIKSLYFMPFLGSTIADETEGYFFIPDGCGALMRFQKVTSYDSAITGRIYGIDPGIDSVASSGNLLSSRSNDYLVDENVMTLPLFGIVHGEGQNGILAIVEGGVEQAYITANPAGYNTDYNWCTVRFDYRTSYMKPVNQVGTGVYTPQEEANDISPSVEYVFLTGDDADYSFMAVYYRDRLEENGELPETEAEDEIPLWLSILGAEVKEGVLFNTTSVLTDVEDAQTITQTLINSGISNIRTCYIGWESGGLSGSSYNNISLDSRLGSRSDVEDWQELLEEAGGTLYLYSNIGQANEDQITLRSQAAMNISSSYICYTTDNDSLMYPDSYVLKLDVVENKFSKLCSKWDGFSLALDNIGTSPYSDYTRGDNVTRLECMTRLSEMLDTDTDTDVALFEPSQYQWEYVSDYLEMSMTNSQYLCETDTVPFLQIVLKGSLNYYASYMNLGFYSDNAVLKMVEYGAYPAFVVAQAESSELEDTPLEDMFSVCFDDWDERILQIYEYIADALNAVEGMTITEHQMVASGVARVTYSGDVVIYVNYNNQSVTVDGVTIAAMSYLVEGGD